MLIQYKTINVHAVVTPYFIDRKITCHLVNLILYFRSTYNVPVLYTYVNPYTQQPNIPCTRLEI